MARNQEKAQTMLNRCVAPRMMQGWQPLTTAATATDLATIEPGSHSTHAARDWCLSQQLLQRKMHPVHPGNLSAKHLPSTMSWRRYLSGKAEEKRGPRQKRPYLASECHDLVDADKWRQQILREIGKKVMEIQNGGLGEHRCGAWWAR